MKRLSLSSLVVVLFLIGVETAAMAVQNDAAVAEQPASPRAVGHPLFVSPHASPIAAHDGRVYVANTPSDTVDVIDAISATVVARVAVGVDPVSVAIRPDGKEVWVSNHVSDTVSVIDSDLESPTYLQVVATIQEFDRESGATQFDEPVAIAFANSSKAYVALSSENTIAVVDTASRRVTKRLKINAQDPRAIVVRGERLYVIPFESNNQTQLSGGTGKIDGELVTFNAFEHSVANNNVLSLGAVLDIVKHPRVPDHDLYVFDTGTDQLIRVVDTVGTLLYGLTVDSRGRVFVAQTDARNDVNGRAGTKNHGLKELGNRAFLNRITRVDFDDEGKPGTPVPFELEPLPPNDPEPGMALATPFAVAISDDDRTLVGTAAGSDKLFVLDAEDGEVTGRVDVGEVPRGIALAGDAIGNDLHAWVFNAVGNSVTKVSLQDLTRPQVVTTVALADPTPPQVKRGRIAFNTASASTSGTYSCASCHPDGHTDQLLWVLKTPVVTGGDQIMPRSTMPVRGLRDTEPYHWDGIPGDPYGGNNSANVHGSDPPNSSLDDPSSSIRHLIDGGLAATMRRVDSPTVNDEGKAGALSSAERDDMASFLLSIPYPPAQRRSFTNVVSQRAKQGFKLFHVDGDLDGKPRPNVCGNCHRMPFLVSTNTPGTGMDAPTWRGAYDRWLILPQGRLNIIDFDFFRRVAEDGLAERSIWQFSWAGRRRFDPVWDMVLEASTGFSGSFARQWTLDKHTADDDQGTKLLDALERSAEEGDTVLELDGAFTRGPVGKPVRMQFQPRDDGGVYFEKGMRTREYSRQKLVALARKQQFVGTFSARHGAAVGPEHPQPALWTLGPIERQRGRQKFPFLYEGKQSMSISGRHIDHDAALMVDGRRVGGSLELNDSTVTVRLDSLPTAGMHLLQLQNPGGMCSNEFLFFVAEDEADARERERNIDRQHVDRREALSRAVERGDLEQVRRLVRAGADVNARRPGSGSTPLSDAALRGNVPAMRLLIDHGAKVEATNRDGNTALHVAAFLCQREAVELLLRRGGSVGQVNGREESPIDVVASPWSDQLAGFYRAVGNATGQELDLDQIRRDRPEIEELLRSHDGERDSSDLKRAEPTE